MKVVPFVFRILHFFLFEYFWLCLAHLDFILQSRGCAVGRIQMEEYRWKDTDGRKQIEAYRWKDTDGRIQMGGYRRGNDLSTTLRIEAFLSK